MVLQERTDIIRYITADENPELRRFIAEHNPLPEGLVEPKFEGVRVFQNKMVLEITRPADVLTSGWLARGRLLRSFWYNQQEEKPEIIVCQSGLP